MDRWCRQQGYECRVVATLAMLSLPLLLFLSTTRQPIEAEIRAFAPAEYTKSVRYEQLDHTLIYGDETLLRRLPPQVHDGLYRSFVANMPIVCVDVLLTRSDGRVLLVRRHAEPVRGVYWFPGGRLLMGETFIEAAARKGHKETGLRIQVSEMLGTWNTFFERSAWGGATQTVNVLMHATTQDRYTEELRICGDRKGRCPNGSHGHFKWISADTSEGEDTYVLEGLAKLRESKLRHDPRVRLGSGKSEVFT